VIELKRQMAKLLIFETHPIQYRAPVFQALERMRPGQFEVIYASDFSIRGHKDVGFNENVAWDVPLLTGYRYRVLGNEKGRGIETWSGLSARGVDRIINDAQPSAILLSSLSYAFSWAAYLGALRRRIPVWIRVETQDEAFSRGKIKSVFRSLVYRVIYLGVSKAFYIGALNREHLLRHGVSSGRLVAAHYCVADHLVNASEVEKNRLRDDLRSRFSIRGEDLVISFFGKLIEKKDPGILLRSLGRLKIKGARRVHCLIVGSGELEPALRLQAKELEASNDVRTIFTGFINQSQLPPYYLASDIVVLPSHRMGETWGLVINEALQAGCGAIVSEMVGCHKDFSGWERVRVFPHGNSEELARALEDLAAYPRSFDWARDKLKDYSVDRAALALLNSLDAMPEP
jgi:glycosyltransferase involved in cell wall biosynthesis